MPEMGTEASQNYEIAAGGWCCLRCGATVAYGRQELHDRWHQLLPEAKSLLWVEGRDT